MKKSATRLAVYVIIASILASLFLTSCTRYIVERTGGGCGVWYPRVFNPDRAGYGENPRGAAGWNK